MSEKRPPDFSNDEIHIIGDTLKERYGREVELQLTDAEMRLNPALTETTLCPVVSWEIDDCHFVVAKVDTYHFMNQFYYRPSQNYTTEKRRYDDLLDCMVSLLRTQADHEQKEQAVAGMK